MKKIFNLAFAFVALLSIMLVSCSEEQEEQTTQTTTNPNKEIVAELHSFIGKTSGEVITILNQKCANWSSHTNTAGDITYRSPDSTKVYMICYGNYNNDIVYDARYIYYPHSNPRNYLQMYEDFEEQLNCYGTNDNFSGSIQYSNTNHDLFCYITRANYLTGYELKKDTLNATGESIAFMDNDTGYRVNGLVSWSDGTFNNTEAIMIVGFTNYYIKKITIK